MYLLNHTGQTTPRVNSDVICICSLKMHQYWFISFNRCTTLMQDINEGKVGMEVGKGIYGNFLYFLLMSYKISKNKSILIFSKSQSQKFILYDSIDITFLNLYHRNREWRIGCQRLEGRGCRNVWGWRWFWLYKTSRRILLMMALFCILTVVVVTWIYTYDKIAYNYTPHIH